MCETREYELQQWEGQYEEMLCNKNVIPSSPTVPGHLHFHFEHKEQE